MLINLTDYFHKDEKTGDYEVKFESKAFSYEGIDYPICSDENASIHVMVVASGKVNIKGSFLVTLQSECARCLEPVQFPVNIAFDLDAYDPNGSVSFDPEEQWFMNGYELDTELLIQNELIMGLPIRVLCKDDCKGLCPKCGSNRNKCDCGCDTFVPDPRMAAIQDIFNANNKEV